MVLVAALTALPAPEYLIPLIERCFETPAERAVAVLLSYTVYTT